MSFDLFYIISLLLLLLLFVFCLFILFYDCMKGIFIFIFGCLSLTLRLLVFFALV